jgi:hypothetical protein
MRSRIDGRVGRMTRSRTGYRKDAMIPIPLAHDSTLAPTAGHQVAAHSGVWPSAWPSLLTAPAAVALLCLFLVALTHLEPKNKPGQSPPMTGSDQGRVRRRPSVTARTAARRPSTTGRDRRAGAGTSAGTAVRTRATVGASGRHR